MVNVMCKKKPSIINRYLMEIRSASVQVDRLRFRQNLERIGEILGYEISQTLDFLDTEVETPLGVAQISLPKENVVVANILRAGLPMHNGLLRVFDRADNAFVSAYRQHHKDGTFEINVEYVSCPSLEGVILIICDPMLATGASMEASIEALLRFGTPSQIHIVTAIASEQGLNFVRRIFPQARIWMGDLDEELTAKSYIVPGLGDAGDLAFGSKVQD